MSELPKKPLLPLYQEVYDDIKSCIGTDKDWSDPELVAYKELLKKELKESGFEEKE